MRNEARSGSPNYSDSTTLSHAMDSADIARRASTASDDLRQTALASGQPVLPEELCEQLHAAVENAAWKSAESINALRLAVKRFTVALRDDGAKPEAVLIAIKSVIEAQTFAIEFDATPDRARRDIRQQISTWSIQEFFGERQA